MKNIMLIIAASLVSFATFSQSSFILDQYIKREYSKGLIPTNEKVCTVSEENETFYTFGLSFLEDSENITRVLDHAEVLFASYNLKLKINMKKLIIGLVDGSLRSSIIIDKTIDNHYLSVYATNMYLFVEVKVSE